MYKDDYYNNLRYVGETLEQAKARIVAKRLHKKKKGARIEVLKAN
jgi:hypothetical protein